MGASKTPTYAHHVLRALALAGSAEAPAQAKVHAARFLAAHVQQAISNAGGAAQPRLAAAVPGSGLATLAPHVLQAIGRANVQRCANPRVQAPGVLVAPTVIQPMRRESRQVKNALKGQQLYSALIVAISQTAAVGQTDVGWVVQKSDDDDSYACDAAVSTGANSYAGSYSGVTGIHAEMAALANFVATGSGRFSDIQVIRITKPTCPRCAYVLKSLRIEDKVRYPKGTDLANRKGPGWTMPGGLKDPFFYDDPLDNALSDFMGAGYSREEAFDLVVKALQTA